MALKQLTPDEAHDRLSWLVNLSGNEVRQGLLITGEYDEAFVEKLREISRVASQVAKHYEDRIVAADLAEIARVSGRG